MAQASQFEFTQAETITALLKAANVREGKWGLLVTFNFAAMNAGPNPNDLMPGAFVGVQRIGLVRVPNESFTGTSVDAATLW